MLGPRERASSMQVDFLNLQVTLQVGFSNLQVGSSDFAGWLREIT